MLYHVMWSTYGSWLPGDPRGFRTRDHRQHVDGDYRNPPETDYSGLHASARRNLHYRIVVIPPELRGIAGEAALKRIEVERIEPRALSVGGQHVHLACDAPPEGLKQRIGRVKKVASHAIRSQLPGAVWARGCKLVRVLSASHWERLMSYIPDHGAEEGAWVWVGESGSSA